jgi:glutamine amidotransferase
MGLTSVRIVVCEAGIGNVRSVVRAVERAIGGSPPATRPAHPQTSSDHPPVEADIVVSGVPAEVARADIVVNPGQGAFATFAGAMHGGLGDALVGHIRSGKPYLGICLGMQVLFETSDEAPGERGLGIFAGDVRWLTRPVDPVTGEKLRLPHIGWNAVRPNPASPSGAVFAPDAGEARHFYFAHSFAVVPADPSLVCATTDYGVPFVSAVAKDNVLGVQFHPEKSQAEGLRLLGDFFRRHARR